MAADKLCNCTLRIGMDSMVLRRTSSKFNMVGKMICGDPSDGSNGGKEVMLQSSMSGTCLSTRKYRSYPCFSRGRSA